MDPTQTQAQREAEMARTRALYDKLLRLCAEVEHQAAQARAKLEEDPIDEVSKELLRPGGSLAAFSDAHRIIVIDALRTDFQGIPEGCGAGERAKDVEAERRRRARAAEGVASSSSRPDGAPPSGSTADGQELGPPIPPGWHSEMALTTLLGVDKKLFRKAARGFGSHGKTTPSKRSEAARPTHDASTSERCEPRDGVLEGNLDAALERAGGDASTSGAEEPDAAAAADGNDKANCSASGGDDKANGSTGGNESANSNADDDTTIRLGDATTGESQPRSGDASGASSEGGEALAAGNGETTPQVGLGSASGAGPCANGRRDGIDGTRERTPRDAESSPPPVETRAPASSDRDAPSSASPSSSLEFSPPSLPSGLHLSADPARALLQRRQLRLVQILSAYALHDPETGYCQGMADLAAVPVLVFARDDALAWAATERLMRSARVNFRHDETGIRMQLGQIANILHDTDPALFARLRELDCADCTFAYRMVVVRLRRELRYREALTLWEMSWAGDLEQQRAVAKARERAERRARREVKAERLERERTRGDKTEGKEGRRTAHKGSAKPHRPHEGPAARAAPPLDAAAGNDALNGGRLSPVPSSLDAIPTEASRLGVRSARPDRDGREESSTSARGSRPPKAGGAPGSPPGLAAATPESTPRDEAPQGGASGFAKAIAQSSDDDVEMASGQAWRAGRAGAGKTSSASSARGSGGSGSDTSATALSTASSLGLAPQAAPNDLANRRRAIVEAALVENAMPLTWSQRLELPATIGSGGGIDSATSSSSTVLANGEAPASGRGGASAPAPSGPSAATPPGPASGRRALRGRGESFSRAEPLPPDLVVHFVVAVVRSQRSVVMRRCKSLDDVLRLFNSVKIDFWLSLAQARKQFKAYNQGLAVLRRAS